MKAKIDNLKLIKKVCRKLDIAVSNLEKANGTLLLTHKDKLLIVGTKDPGFYPHSKRWNAYFTRNKSRTQKILKALNYPTISSIDINPAQYTTDKELKRALTKIKTFPRLLKPNYGLKGRGIVVVNSQAELKKHSATFHQKKESFMVQELLDHNEYRFMVVNYRLALVHTKKFPEIIGDGKSTVATLLRTLPEKMVDHGFLDLQLKTRKYTKKSVLKTAESLAVSSTKKPYVGCVYDKPFPKPLVRWCEDLAKKIDAPVLGIDAFSKTDLKTPKDFVIIELNSNPGLDYLRTHCERADLAEEIYRSVLTEYFGM